MSGKRNRWFERKRAQALYTKVRPMVESNEMFQAARAALQAGCKEVHLGWEHCALCGEELGEAVESEMLTDAGEGSAKVQIHLCDRCWYKYRASQRRN